MTTAKRLLSLVAHLAECRRQVARLVKDIVIMMIMKKLLHYERAGHFVLQNRGVHYDFVTYPFLSTVLQYQMIMLWSCSLGS